LAAPHTSQAAAAGARGGVRGELAVELGEERTPLASRSSAPAAVSAEFFASVARSSRPEAAGIPASASDRSLQMHLRWARPRRSQQTFAGGSL